MRLRILCHNGVTRGDAVCPWLTRFPPTINRVTLAPGLVIQSQSIGVASRSRGFAGVDGILGIGPTDLTEGTLFPAFTAQIPTVTDNLFSQGTIDSYEIGFSFEPITSEFETNGEIIFGGTDASKFTGSISFTPVASTSPASTYWGIDQSVTYQEATGAVLDNTTGLLRLTTTQFANLQSLNFHIGGVRGAISYTFSAGLYLIDIISPTFRAGSP
ncbi:aspartic peptidase domain-containing protein [Gautieria morchelliformis]|nr:aspartic peptidase domain-containing protein [Gautieria morchelliformis]